MPVPITGSYRMFDTGSEANPNSNSIRGAQKHNASDPVETNTKFSENIGDAKVPLFDTYYAGNVHELSEISASLQFRNYPADANCYTCSFEEISDPSIIPLTFSCSILDPQVTIRMSAGGNTSAINGAISIQASISSSYTAYISSFSNPPEQFLGWSFTEDGSSGYLGTSTYYTHTMTGSGVYPGKELTIYAIADLSDAISEEFCFQPSGTGKTEICEECGYSVVVYFDQSEYNIKPLEDLIWYNSVGLGTNYRSSGYYRRNTTTTRRSAFGITKTKTIIDSTIYYVTGSSGEANIWDSCNGFISCT